jgi:hypothetical protein
METLTFKPQQAAAFPFSKKFPFEIRVLSPDADRSEVYALRYRAYRDAWCIPIDTSEKISDRHDGLASSALITAYDGAQCVGALRVCFSHRDDTHLTLPCAPYYPAVQELKRSSAGSLVEMSRLAIEPTISNTSYRTTLYASLVRAGFMAAQAAEVSMILIATRPEWVRFYNYMLGFKTIGEPAMYPPGDVPIALLAGTFAEAQKRQRAQNAFFKITADEIASMKRAIAPALMLPSSLQASAKVRF